MNFKTQYADYAVIEDQIRRARVERAVVIAHVIAATTDRIIRGIRNLFESVGRGIQAAHERQLIEADSFLKRSVPHY